MTAVLSISSLRKDFRAPGGSVRRVLDVPALELGGGRQLAFRGPSGSGKTTLLHAIAGLLRPDSGEIRILGEAMTGRSEADRDRLRAARIGIVFQGFHLLQGYTAEENVELAMLLSGRREPARARELLARVGLADHLRDRPRQLSSGQQQRVALARALANRPVLVLADEPAAHLDPSAAATALALLREVCVESGAALLLVSHDPEVLSGFEHVEEFSAINRAMPQVPVISGERATEIRG